MFDELPVGTDGELDAPSTVLLRSVVERAPGPAAVEMLAGLDPTQLDETGRLLLVSALERQARWLAALSHAAVAALTAPGWLRDRQDDWVAEELACALGLSPRTAGSRLALARRLAGPLAATAAALRAGTISAVHARMLAEETEPLDDDVTAKVQAAVLAKAGRQTPGDFRRTVTRAIATAHPVVAEAAHAEAVEQRSVVDYPEPAGMATVVARLPADGAALVMTALDACAARLGPEDPRGIDARRADVLVDWACQALDDPAEPNGRRPRSAVQVTIDLPTLLGLADHPGELAGYGPIPASAARALAADGKWRRLVTDPETGALLDLARRSYTPSAALREFLLARDGTCRFPGCPVPAERCDLDHGVAWDAGGTTDRDNLGPLCRRHHRLKTHALWQLKRHPDASVTWTSPRGFRYHLPPPKVPPD